MPLAPSVQERYLGLFFSEIVAVSVVLVEATSISTWDSEVVWEVERGAYIDRHTFLAEAHVGEPSIYPQRGLTMVFSLVTIQQAAACKKILEAPCFCRMRSSVHPQVHGEDERTASSNWRVRFRFDRSVFRDLFHDL